MIQNLLPLFQRATALRRIVTVGGGGFEGKIDPTDFQALRVPLPELREHLTTLVTLGMEAVSRSVSDVSIVHSYPGTVKTPFLNHMPEEMMKELTFVPLDECGERHVFLATSARYPPANGSFVAVISEPRAEVALGSNGQVGSGIYSVGVNCEGPSAVVQEKLAGLRKIGMVDEVWKHTEGEFKRVTESEISPHA